TDQNSIELVKEPGAWRLVLAQGRRQVVPGHLVEEFMNASEELSRSAEVYSSSSPPVEYRVRYEDASGELLHELAIHARDEDATSVYATAGDVLYELVVKSFVRFQKACDDLVLAGQQMTEQQN